MRKTGRKTQRAKRSSSQSVRHRRSGQQPGSVSRSPHRTSPAANIFAELGFGVEEAENLRMRAELMTELRHLIAGVTQREAASLLRTTQARVSHLVRGRIDLFTIDTLVNMLGHAGVKLRITVHRPRPSTAA
jgi:predicted XRE-type DNA-binding protein